MGAVAVKKASSEIYWLGADVAKRTFDAAIVAPGQHYPETSLREVPAATFPRTPEGVERFLLWMRQHVGDDMALRLVMEATGVYSLELAGWLLEKCRQLAPAIINPQQSSAFMKSLGLRNKTDRMEARGLAFYGAERRPVPHEPLSAARAELCTLSRYRDVLVEEKVAESNRGEVLGASALVRQLHEARLERIKRDIEQVEADMKRVIEADVMLQEHFVYLHSANGVGFITAVVLLAEIGDLSRFRSARQLSAFVGVSPRLFESGTSVRLRPRMSKNGSPRVRQALYMAAMANVRMPGKLQEDYLRLIAAGKTKKQALGAIMRKLLVMLRALVRDKAEYKTCGKTCGKPVCESRKSAEDVEKEVATT